MTIRLLPLVVALATQVWAGESSTVPRAADDGLSPDFCRTLRTNVAAAANGWSGTTRLPGAIECSLFGGTPRAYACTLYAGDVGENADGTYERVARGMKDCLGDGWKTTERADGVHARTTIAAGAAAPSVRLVSHDATADGYLVELWVDAAGR